MESFFKIARNKNEGESQNTRLKRKLPGLKQIISAMRAPKVYCTLWYLDNKSISIISQREIHERASTETSIRSSLME